MPIFFKLDFEISRQPYGDDFGPKVRKKKNYKSDTLSALSASKPAY